MRDILIKRILPISFILSLLIHLLLLTIATYRPWKTIEKEKLPDLYQPAYLYQGGITPTPSSLHTSDQTTNESSQTTQSITQTVSNQADIPLGQQTKQRALRKKQNSVKKRSVLEMTNQFLQQDYTHMMAAANADQAEEPIYLIGSPDSPVDPVVRLLGRALSAHLNYPRVAGAFGIRGRAVIGLTLHPSGRITNIRLLQSANHQDLDAAALHAVHHAPIVKGVDKFLSKPKYFVIGFVFR